MSVHRRPAAIRNPAQLVVLAYAVAMTVGATLLSLPWAYDTHRPPALIDSLFLATSAVTVTGLATFDVTDLSWFGEVVVMALMQIGGFGIMAGGSLLAVIALRRMGVRQRILAQAEIGAMSQAEMRTLVKRIALITLTVEAALAALLALRFWTAYDHSLWSGAYQGVFHSVSAFNNAGIALHSDNLMRYLRDPIVTLGMTVAIIIGGLGFPVITQLVRIPRRRGGTVPYRRRDLHFRITVAGTVVLLVVGPLFIAMFEWSNPGTLGPLSIGDKLLGAWFQGVTPRTAGFNVVDVGAMEETSLLWTTILMFIGGGPASTAGGIKVTTFALLGYVLWSEVRGDSEVNVLHRRVPATAIRQAVTVVIMAIGSIMAVTVVLLVTADLSLMPALFESVSAFATVGLSTGITGDLSTVAKASLILLMLAGRVGPTTLVTALAYRQRLQRITYPVERPIIG